MPNTGGGAIDCMKIHLGPQSLKITQCIQCKSPLILKNQFWYTSSFVLFFSTWLERERRERERERERERRVAGFRWWERKSSFTLFLAIKMSFLNIHKFHKLRGASWWFFTASMLHEKPYMSRESQN
jgi:hypothetical protein